MRTRHLFLQRMDEKDAGASQVAHYKLCQLNGLTVRVAGHRHPGRVERYVIELNPVGYDDFHASQRAKITLVMLMGSTRSFIACPQSS
ncbi:hypothetical protein [Noviherbaspirillum aerium]|uniref:hypothetical protein n=1 Tax=Noviherbaspirillum aerium TaxID=2588497 RepID=UPI00124E0B55|nr:hypothetical protein [Noviherbaspirillum aerium]